MNDVRAAIYDALAGSDGLTDLLAAGSASIFHRVAPASAVAPYVIFAKQAGTPEYAFGGSDTETLENDLWNVRGIVKGLSVLPADAIAEEIRLALSGTIAVTGRRTLYLQRDSDLDYGETSNGEVWQHVGGIYRLITQREAD